MLNPVATGQADRTSLATPGLASTSAPTIARKDVRSVRIKIDPLGAHATFDLGKVRPGDFDLDKSALKNFGNLFPADIVFVGPWTSPGCPKRIRKIEMRGSPVISFFAFHAA